MGQWSLGRRSLSDLLDLMAVVHYRRGGGLFANMGGSQSACIDTHGTGRGGTKVVVLGLTWMPSDFR